MRLPLRLAFTYCLAVTISLVFSAHQNTKKDQYDLRMKEVDAAPMISEESIIDQRSGVMVSEPVQDNRDDESPHDSDDEPMVYVTPKDYATSARQNRNRLIAEGADPNSVIFESEIPNHIPYREGE